MPARKTGGDKGGGLVATTRVSESPIIQPSSPSNQRRSRVQRQGSMKQDNALMLLMREEMKKTTTWQRKIFGIGPSVMGIHGSRLIHPHSPFAQGMAIVSAILLIYTAIVTPFLVGFLWNVDKCWKSPTLYFELFIDTFFIVEIFISFFIGIRVHGKYYDDLWTVVTTYLKGSFLFDICTSIPVSYIEFFTLQECDRDAGAASRSGLRVVRIIKPLRLFKLLRVIKTMKVLSLIDDIETKLKIPAVIFRMTRVLCMIFYIVHIAACGYWLVKELTHPIADFQAWVQDELAADQVYEPDEALGDKYVLAIYFINTVFSTVGFGDITPMNTAERLYSILVMYLGTLVFATLLSEVESFMEQLRRFQRSKANLLFELREFLRSQDVPASLEQKVTRWVEFDHECRFDHEARNKALDAVPPGIRVELVDFLHRDALLAIPIFSRLEHSHAREFLLEVFENMRPRTFSPFMSVLRRGWRTGGLFLIVSGNIRVSVSDGTLDGKLPSLCAGDYFGEFSLLADYFPEPSIGQLSDANLTSMSYSMCLYISSETFLTILGNYSSDLEEELLAHHEAMRCDRFETLVPLENSDDAEDEGTNHVEHRWFSVTKKFMAKQLSFRLQRIIEARIRKTGHFLPLPTHRGPSDDPGSIPAVKFPRLASRANLMDDASPIGLGRAESTLTEPTLARASSMERPSSIWTGSGHMSQTTGDHFMPPGLAARVARPQTSDTVLILERMDQLAEEVRRNKSNLEAIHQDVTIIKLKLLMPQTPVSWSEPPTPPASSQSNPGYQKSHAALATDPVKQLLPIMDDSEDTQCLSSAAPQPANPSAESAESLNTQNDDSKEPPRASHETSASTRPPTQAVQPHTGMDLNGNSHLPSLEGLRDVEAETLLSRDKAVPEMLNTKESDVDRTVAAQETALHPRSTEPPGIGDLSVGADDKPHNPPAGQLSNSTALLPFQLEHMPEKAKQLRAALDSEPLAVKADVGPAAVGVARHNGEAQVLSQATASRDGFIELGKVPHSQRIDGPHVDILSPPQSYSRRSPEQPSQHPTPTTQTSESRANRGGEADWRLARGINLSASRNISPISFGRKGVMKVWGSNGSRVNPSTHPTLNSSPASMSSSAAQGHNPSDNQPANPSAPLYEAHSQLASDPLEVADGELPSVSDFTGTEGLGPEGLDSAPLTPISVDFPPLGTQLQPSVVQPSNLTSSESLNSSSPYYSWTNTRPNENVV